MNPNKLYCQANKGIFNELDARITALEQGGGGGGDGGWVLATSNLYSDYVDENGKFKKDFIIEIDPLLHVKTECKKGFLLSENNQFSKQDFQPKFEEGYFIDQGGYFANVTLKIEQDGTGASSTIGVSCYAMVVDWMNHPYTQLDGDAVTNMEVTLLNGAETEEELYTPLTFSQTLSDTTYRIWVKE